MIGTNWKRAETMVFLKSLYIFSIALLVFAFIVFAISAVPVPEAPSIPPELQSIGQNPTAEQQQLLAEQSQQQQDFRAQVSLYNGVLSFVIIGVAVGLLVGSILRLGRMPIIGDGVTLGAVFTLLYGIYYAYSNVYSTGAGLIPFVAVALGLGLLLALVYRRFVRSKEGAEGHPEHKTNDAAVTTAKKQGAVS